MGAAGIEARQMSDLKISGVYIDNNKMEGIVLSGIDGATLSGNAMTGNGAGLPASAPLVRVEGMLQDFGDSDVE